MICNWNGKRQMPRIDEAIDIKAPLERVFQYIADPTTQTDWVKWAKSSEVTSLEKTGLGATSTMSMQVGPRKEQVDTIVTEYKADEYLTRRNTRGLQMTDRLAVVRIGDSTKVAWSIDYSPPMGALGKLVDFLFMERLFDQLMKDSLTNLKERLETAR